MPTNSGNKNASGKAVKYGSEMAQRIRKAILNAFDAAERDGELISDMLAVKLKENPLRFLEVAAKYTPNDVNIETTINKKANELTTEELTDLIGEHARKQREALEKEQEKQTDRADYA